MQKNPTKLRCFFKRDLPCRATHMEWQRVTNFEHFFCQGSLARKKNAIDPWHMDAFIRAHPFIRVHTHTTHTRTCTRTRSRTRACEHEVAASCVFSLKSLNSRTPLCHIQREQVWWVVLCLCLCISLIYSLSLALSHIFSLTCSLCTPLWQRTSIQRRQVRKNMWERASEREPVQESSWERYTNTDTDTQQLTTPQTFHPQPFTSPRPPS